MKRHLLCLVLTLGLFILPLAHCQTQGGTATAVRTGASFPQSARVNTLFILTGSGLYRCNNAPTCTTAANWKAVEGGVAYGTTWQGTIPASTELLFVPSGVSWYLPANCAGSTFVAKAPAATTTTFTIYKNGSAIGAISIAANSSTGTFTCTATTFAATDTIEIVGGGDSQLATVGITVYGSR